jgi:hypothetical protein
MYFAFLDITDSVTLFMERGGPVLNVIAMLLLVKWSLVFERIWYLNTTHKANVKNTLAAWNARSDTKSWRWRCEVNGGRGVYGNHTNNGGHGRCYLGDFRF